MNVFTIERRKDFVSRPISVSYTALPYSNWKHQYSNILFFLLIAKYLGKYKFKPHVQFHKSIQDCAFVSETLSCNQENDFLTHFHIKNAGLHLILGCHDQGTHLTQDTLHMLLFCVIHRFLLYCILDWLTTWITGELWGHGITKFFRGLWFEISSLFAVIFLSSPLSLLVCTLRFFSSSTVCADTPFRVFAESVILFRFLCF